MATQPRETEIVGNATARFAAEQERLLILPENEIIEERVKNLPYLDPREDRVKIDPFGHIFVTSYHEKEADRDNVSRRRFTPHIDIDSATRAMAHRKDAGSLTLKRVNTMLNLTEEVLREIGRENELTEEEFEAVKEKVTNRLAEEGFVDPEKDRIRAIKPTRKEAVRQISWRGVTLDDLISGRRLIARTMTAAGRVKWLKELIISTKADRKAAELFVFLSGKRKESIDGFEGTLAWVNSVQGTLRRKSVSAILPAQMDSFKKFTLTKLDSEFRPYLEPAVLVKALLFGKLDLDAVQTLFSQQLDDEVRLERYRDFIRFVTELRPVDALAKGIVAGSEEDRMELWERLEAVKGILSGTLAFSRFNLAHSRRKKPNPTYGFETEPLPFDNPV